MRKVQVLLSTYNGAKYIREQIESLTKQIGVEINILVRDDGSFDETVNLLTSWEKDGILDFYQGRNMKPAKSFIDLIKNAPESDYYAFCDQDDYWEKDKLINAINKIDDYVDSPALYFSKAQLVDESLNPIDYKGYPEKVCTFGQALIKNNASGCTMVFNKRLLEIIRRYDPQFINMHDHWTYLLCLAIGGKVIFDQNSYIKYRQHDYNYVGGKDNIIREYKNKLNMLLNKNRDRSRIAKELKIGFYDLMTVENKLIVDEVINYTQSITNKWCLITDKKISATTFKNKLFFTIAVLLDAF